VSEVVTFVGYRPPARYDQLPWTQAVIQEAATETGSYTTVDTVTLTPVDSRPVRPGPTVVHDRARHRPRLLVPGSVPRRNGRQQPADQPDPERRRINRGHARLRDPGRAATGAAETAPTAAETVAMQRDLDVAAREIDWDLSYDPASNPAPAPATAEYALLADVNLDRAVELWATHQRPFGAQQAGADMMPLVAPRDTWHRHHLRLNPLRTSFGVA
jgi:hypothetical protein